MSTGLRCAQGLTFAMDYSSPAQCLHVHSYLLNRGQNVQENSNFAATIYNKVKFMADKIEKMNIEYVSVPNSSVTTDELSKSAIAELQ